MTLWVRAGVGKTSRNIPLHEITGHYGISFCSILPALHHLTGTDYLSKVGTKLPALESSPEMYLSNFGEGNFFYV